MGSEVNVVKSGTCVIKYEIRQHDDQGEVYFSWVTKTGSESEWGFESIEEAETDVKEHLG